MTEYFIEKFYNEYALKKEDTIIAIIDSGTNAKKVCDLLNEQDEQIQLLVSELKHINKQKHNLVNFLKKNCHSVEEIRKIANDGDVE
jgi:hypothetical protein